MNTGERPEKAGQVVGDYRQAITSKGIGCGVAVEGEGIYLWTQAADYMSQQGFSLYYQQGFVLSQHAARAPPGED